MQTDTEILIIGGGIAGCIAAIALVDNYRVTLIDQLTQPVERIGESLAPAAQRILRQLNLLKGMDVQGIYLKNQGMQSYWGSNKVEIVDHLRNPDGMGRNLNRKAFEEYLRKMARERGVNCIWPAKLTQSEYRNNYWAITFKSREETFGLTAGFVVDATGRQSHFARSQEIERHVEDKLISCWISLPNNQKNCMSTLSADEQGWWYSAVVPNNQRVLAYQTDSDLVENHSLKNLESLLGLVQKNKEMAQLVEKNLGKIRFHGTVAANSTRLAKVAGKQWVALGDAALSFDPLSSQGMFHAMASALQCKALLEELNLIHHPQKMETFEKAYTFQTNQIWSHYLKHKKFYYNQEKRWANALFWRRRG